MADEKTSKDKIMSDEELDKVAGGTPIGGSASPARGMTLQQAEIMRTDTWLKVMPPRLVLKRTVFG